MAPQAVSQDAAAGCEPGCGPKYNIAAIAITVVIDAVIAVTATIDTCVASISVNVIATMEKRMPKNTTLNPQAC